MHRGTDPQQATIRTGGSRRAGRRRWGRVVTMLALVAATTTALSALSGAARAATIAPGSQYVAIGSSIAAGPVLTPLVDGGCLRSGSNYPSLVARTLSLRLVDVSCSAATTANVLTTPQKLSSGAANPVQINAVGPETRLVTVSIGGNDLQYVGRLTANSCANSAASALPGVCDAIAATPSTTPTDADFTTVENRLVQIVGTARSRAPLATVVLVDYLPILDPNDRSCAVVPLTDTQWQTGYRVATGLATATRRAAERTGAVLVRSSALGVGHTPCSPDPWMSGFQAPGLTGGPLPYHATGAGMAAVAAEVVRAIG